MNSRVYGCGSHAGYVWHIRHGEEVCVFCREAANEYNRALRASKRKPKRAGPPPLDWAKCGTHLQYERHRRLGQKPCTPCRLAYNRWVADHRASRAKPGAKKGRPKGSLDSYPRKRASCPHDLDSSTPNE